MRKISEREREQNDDDDYGQENCSKTTQKCI